MSICAAWWPHEKVLDSLQLLLSFERKLLSQDHSLGSQRLLLLSLRNSSPALTSSSRSGSLLPRPLRLSLTAVFWVLVFLLLWGSALDRNTSWLELGPEGWRDGSVSKGANLGWIPQLGKKLKAVVCARESSVPTLG